MNLSLCVIVAIVALERLHHHTLVEAVSLPPEKQWMYINSHVGGQLPPQGGDRHKGIGVSTNLTRAVDRISSRVRGTTEAHANSMNIQLLGELIFQLLSERKSQ